jgi:hypothetical protein
MARPYVSSILAEHGFWDYTTPGAGGMEGYGKDDYELLLDDMERMAMNSVVVMAKWLTTGYRSRLPFLDQHPDNPVTASDNRLLADFLEAAARRGMRTWIGAVASMYPTRMARSLPSMTFEDQFGGFPLPEPVGIYDADTPEVREYSVRLMEDLYAQFPGVTGFMVELELCDIATPDRIPRYDAWAERNGRPRYQDLARPMASRWLDISSWRDYVTEGRAEILCSIRDALRARGFSGRLSTLCETGFLPYQVQQSVNLELLHTRCPELAAVSYDPNYDKSRCRLGIMEMAVEEPRRAGMESFYLPRGIMTWAGAWPMALTLPEFWKAEQEDITRFRPDGVWWFGSGTGAGTCARPEGAHVSVARLRASGYEDGRAARRAFMQALEGFEGFTAR